MTHEAQNPQHRLFDIGAVPVQEREFMHPVHEALGIHPDEYRDSPYIEIDIDPSAQIYQWSPRGAYRSRYTDMYQNDWDNKVSWDLVEPCDFIYEGFIQCFTRLENGDDVLHLLFDKADIDFSIAIRLGDIRTIRKFPDNASEVMRMHHECLAGTVQEFGRYADHIEYLVNNFLPEPEKVYETE